MLSHAGWLAVQHLGALALGFGVSVAVIPAINRLAHREGILDRPSDDRRAHTVPVPRLGGVAIFLGTVIATAVVMGLGLATGSLDLPYPTLLPGVVIGVSVVFLTGLADDIRGLSPRAKLALQTAAALAVVAFGFTIDQLTLGPTGPALALGLLALPVTILWIVGMTNAFNLIDGIDGLAGSMAVVALAACIGVDIYLHDPRSLIISLAMLGAVVGFLRHNTHPATIFLGDSGSMTLGFFLAIRTVISATSDEGVTYALVPLTALAFPLLDTGVAIARRWLRGHAFSRADGRHIHHQLLALGLPVRSAVTLLVGLFILVAVIGVSVSFAPPRLTLAFVLMGGVLLFAVAVYGTRWLEYSEFTELAGSFASVIRHARWVVQQKIHAADLAERIRRAERWEEVEGILGELTDVLPLIDAELVTVELPAVGPARQQISPRNRLPVRFDFPLAWRGSRGEREMVLRLWSDRPSRDHHPSTERIASRLGPALEAWLEAHPGAIPAPQEQSVSPRVSGETTPPRPAH